MNNMKHTLSLDKAASNFPPHIYYSLVRPFGMQPKLTVSNPGDRYEQEADRVADQVMRMPDDQTASSATLPRIQRMCAGCKEDLQQEKLMQTAKPVLRSVETKSAISPEPTAALENQLTSLQGRGRPMAGVLRRFFEPRFGFDFSHVRIHHDSHAATLARAVNARAFTMGHNVVFGAAQYSPDSRQGQSLIAHELTHVVQQGIGQSIMRQAAATDEYGLVPGPPERSARIPRWIMQQSEDEGTRENTPLARKAISREVSHTSTSTSSPRMLFRVPTGSAAGGSCSWTCSPGSASAYMPTADPTFNCYAYAMNSPGSGFLQPGQTANTVEYRALSGNAAAITSLGGVAAARTHLRNNYFTPSGMRAQMTADLGTPFSANCVGCCSSTRRKVIAVTTGPMSAVGLNHWDFHWYRKDADQGWSHKPGATPSTRADASGSSPICSPCRASRNYGALNYSHVVGAWCV